MAKGRGEGRTDSLMFWDPGAVQVQDFRVQVWDRVGEREEGE